MLSLSQADNASKLLVKPFASLTTGMLISEKGAVVTFATLYHQMQILASEKFSFKPFCQLKISSSFG